MAKCIACNREMLTANGCEFKWIFANGQKFKRIKVGDPGDFFEGEDRDFRCGDCAAKVGYFHHWGCDCERCPACGGQLIDCDCEDVWLDDGKP